MEKERQGSNGNEKSYKAGRSRGKVVIRGCVCQYIVKFAEIYSCSAKSVCLCCVVFCIQRKCKIMATEYGFICVAVYIHGADYKICFKFCPKFLKRVK